MKRRRSAAEKRLADALAAILPLYRELYEAYDPDGAIAAHIEYDIEASEAINMVTPENKST